MAANRFNNPILVNNTAVTKANTTIVLTAGSATVDFSASVATVDNVRNYDALQIFDSAKRAITGFIKSVAGTVITITNTPGGATQNWGVQDASFDKDDAAGFTYRIISKQAYGTLISARTPTSGTLHIATKDGEAMFFHDSIDFSTYAGDDAGVTPYLFVFEDAAGKCAQAYGGAQGGGESLDTEINTGTLVANRLYKITATEVNHFGTGLIVGSYFTSAGTETCDANNKVKALLDVAATGTHLISALGGTTKNIKSIDSGFSANTITKVRVYRSSAQTAAGALMDDSDLFLLDDANAILLED